MIGFFTLSQITSDQYSHITLVNCTLSKHINQVSCITNVYFLFLQLIGGAIFGFSMWLLVDFFVNEYQAASVELKESKYVIYVFVAASAFMVVYSLIGIFGAIKPSWKCLLVIVSPVIV